MLNTDLGRLRVIAFIEGISYLVLVLIAMPLKYLADSPQMVRVVGMAHGVLFVLFCLALLQVFIARRWSFFRGALAFASSLVPFGTFWLERSLKREQQALQTATGR